MFAFVVVLPLSIWVLLWKKFNQLKQKQCIDTFGSLYSGLRIDSKYAVLYNVIYMLRRLYFAHVALDYYSVPFIQIQLLILHSIGLVIFNTLVRPFENRMLNNLEIFNEVCILGAAYHLLLFTD